jgi:predicted nucleotidyltransferase
MAAMMLQLAKLVVIALAVATAPACGGRPPIPPRGVGETAIGGWEFGRFQHMADIEVWVPENRGEAFAGSYVRGAAARGGHLAADDVVNAVVTRYQRPDGVLRATVKFLRRLAQEAGYTVDEEKVEGVRLVVVAGNGERWALWAAGGHVVKLGGRGVTAVPDALIAWYGARYPSTMPRGVMEGPLPAAPDEPGPEPDAPYDPDSPTPDWEGYDPARTQRPASDE